MDNIRFVIYDKDDSYQRTVFARNSDTVLPANVAPTSLFVVDDDDVALPDLLQDGARCAYRFRGVEWFRGMVSKVDGVGPRGSTTMLVEGDFRKLWDWQGSPKPTDDDLSTQRTIDQEYARYTGVTEAVARAALVANFARLGVPWDVAPSSGRGASGQRVEFRWHPLAEKLVPLLDAADLIAELSYEAGTVMVSFRSGVTLPKPITEYTGVMDGYRFNKTKPTATRAVVGGAGEGVEREFIRRVDAARETAWGDIVETFRDSRMSDTSADLSSDALAALADGAPTVGIGMDMQESDRFKFGETFLVGDRIPVRLDRLGDALFTERITQVEITETPDEGVVVTPRLGAVEDSPDAELGAVVARLARGVRDQGRR